jgi:hypothetical protein
MMKKQILMLAILLVGLAITTSSFAQEPPTFDDNPPEGAGPSVPVDGGASLLAAAGLGFAGKRLRQWRAARKA